jgi:hypothetical protein
MRGKSLLVLLLAGGALTVVVNDRSAAQQAKETPAQDEADRIRIGFAVAPVPLALRDKDPNLVGLGSYLVNAVAGCNDCHTNPSYLPTGNPFLGEPTKVNVAGYLAGGQTFGPFTSRNITPDASGNPAGLSFAMFTKVIRTGFDPEHLHPSLGPLLQVMPWPDYSNWSDHDLAAVYEYLRAIPSLPDPAGVT